MADNRGTIHSPRKAPGEDAGGWAKDDYEFGSSPARAKHGAERASERDSSDSAPGRKESM